MDVVHLLVAFALTYILGFERGLRCAGAGDRVFSLIGVGSGLAGALAAHGIPYALAGAITGIGFIGGGLVFRQETGKLELIRGITTAAGIFAAAGIGAVAGSGRMVLATAATGLTLLGLEIRHLKVLRVFDGRKWSPYFKDDDTTDTPPTPPKPS